MYLFGKSSILPNLTENSNSHASIYDIQKNGIFCDLCGLCRSQQWDSRQLHLLYQFLESKDFCATPRHTQEVHHACSEGRQAWQSRQFFMTATLINWISSALVDIFTWHLTAEKKLPLFTSSLFFILLLYKNERVSENLKSAKWMHFAPPSQGLLDALCVEKWCFLKCCVRCGCKLSSLKRPYLCLLCLGEGHKVDCCPLSAKFLKQTVNTVVSALRSWWHWHQLWHWPSLH